MKELSKGELIKWHKRIWKTRISFGDRVFFEEEQAYRQIRQLIENQPICIFCALPITEQEGACKKCANRALEDLSHRPKVDEEFIEKWIDKLKIKVRQRWNDDYYVNPSKEDLKQMLKEAGIRIKEEK